MIESRKHMLPGQRGERKTSSPLSRNSKKKNLLAEEDFDMTSEDIRAKKSDISLLGFDNFVVRSSRYDFPRLGKIPATHYYSTITDMKVREKDGKVILDVYYDLEDSYGRKYHIVQSYPEESQPFNRLSDALAAAGVPDGATVDAGIGITEIIEIDYVSKTSDLGSIVERKPYVRPSAAEDEETDADDEFDDFLSDEDD